MHLNSQRDPGVGREARCAESNAAVETLDPGGVVFVLLGPRDPVPCSQSLLGSFTSQPVGCPVSHPSKALPFPKLRVT